MKVGGHRIREHLRLLMPLFIFLMMVWLLRLALSSAGAPRSVWRLLSVTGAAAVAVFLSAWLIHSRNFGGYTNVVVASLLLNLWGQVLIVAAIVFSVVTNTENVFTRAEFSIKGDDPLHLRHIYGHLTFVTGLGTLFGVGLGCLVLWLLRMMVPGQKIEGGAAQGSGGRGRGIG
jgi:hypothetical protein